MSTRTDQKGFGLRQVLIAILLGLSATGASAYVGELAKDFPDGHIESLASLQARADAYRVLIAWVQSAKPETPMTGDPLRAYRLLRDADEQILQWSAQRFLDQTLETVKRSLPSQQQKRIEGYRVRVTAAFDGPAVLDRSQKAVLIPVDFLRDVWTADMAMNEVDDHDTKQFEAMMIYLMARINPRMRAKMADQAYLAQGLTHVRTGKFWAPSREKWNQTLWSASYQMRGAALHEALHELCHVISDHKDYGEIPRSQAMTQENEADVCAYRLMPDAEKDGFNVTGAFFALLYRPFDEKGNQIISKTHPSVMCRIASIGKSFGKETESFTELLLSEMTALWGSAVDQEARSQMERLLAECKG